MIELWIQADAGVGHVTDRRRAEAALPGVPSQVRLPPGCTISHNFTLETAHRSPNLPCTTVASACGLYGLHSLLCCRHVVEG